MRLADWISNECKDEPGDFILQMDIEGAEYAVIYDTPLEVLRKFRILAIEFHHLDLLVSEGGFDLIRFAFAKLLESFSVVHIHPVIILNQFHSANSLYQLKWNLHSSAMTG